MSADVVGYSRLMGLDEVGTLSALRNHREELIDGKIAEHGGRIVKTMGDGLLLEFPSVVNAVKCAIDVQEGMLARNTEVSEDKRITFRIGVNQGDVIIEGEDIHGDGVNLAARLQETAAPGGISISKRVLEDVRDRLEAPFENTGDQTLKNIARPVEVWRWSPDGMPLAQSATAEAPLPLPDKPSIAVLPFENMSGDPEQEYFSDGIAEDIITDLSKFSWLTVIARNSSFSFKGQSLDLRALAQELNVRYVLEGSVRKSGDRVRVTAQLIDASDGGHIWAQRYDRKLEDIFDLQDEMTRSITTAIGPELEAMEIRRSLEKSSDDLDVWDLTKRAQSKSGNADEKRLIRGP